MKKIRLLLVDDETDFLTAYSRRFERRNAEISIASSGQEAIDKIRDAEFDVVILDVMMPEMNGIETLRRIKAIAPDLPVIILTGHVPIPRRSSRAWTSVPLTSCSSRWVPTNCISRCWMPSDPGSGARSNCRRYAVKNHAQDSFQFHSQKS